MEKVKLFTPATQDERTPSKPSFTFSSHNLCKWNLMVKSVHRRFKNWHHSSGPLFVQRTQVLFCSVGQAWLKSGTWRVKRACCCTIAFDQLEGDRRAGRRALKRWFSENHKFSHRLGDELYLIFLIAGKWTKEFRGCDKGKEPQGRLWWHDTLV